jgi:hypothetical protein
MHSRNEQIQHLKWMVEKLRQLSPKSEIAGAIRYVLSHGSALTRYVENGQLEIDNSAAEWALRAVALGRNYANLRISGKTISSLTPTLVVNAPPRSARSLAQPNSMASIRSSTFALSWHRSPTIRLTASKNCCLAISPPNW